MFPGTDSLACVVLVTREPPLVARYSGRVRWYFCSSPSCIFFLVACCGWLGDPSSLRPLQGSPSIHQAFCIFMSWQKNDRLVEDARTRDPEKAFGAWGDVISEVKMSNGYIRNISTYLEWWRNQKIFPSKGEEGKSRIWPLTGFQRPRWVQARDFIAQFLDNLDW